MKCVYGDWPRRSHSCIVKFRTLVVRGKGMTVPVTEPVLVLAFNRPDHLSTLLDRLRTVRPESVYLAVDGPRASRPGEDARVQECRNLAQAIDWPCDVQTLFQDSNLGCGRGVSTAITWFFRHVDRGIILEDDVIPAPSFFGFCEELLDRYQDDDRVLAINGCSAVPSEHVSTPEASYRFSRIPLVWGWATWRRNWDLYRFDLRGWYHDLGPRALLRAVSYSPSDALYWATEFELTARGAVDTWDWQWMATGMRTGKLTATPNRNLVENIGFDSSATHTTAGSSPLPPAEEMFLPTRPVPVVADRRADAWTTRRYLGGRPLTSMDRMWKFARRSRSRT